MKHHTAVVVVDVQADFTESEGGALAVPGTGEDYLRHVITATEEYHRQGLPVFATQDWHPKNHCSFAENHPGAAAFEVIELPGGRKQVLWPTHCVQDSEGARILIPESLIYRVVRKGMNPDYDSYSGFNDDGGHPTGLEDLLKEEEIESLIVYGLATDYCVRATVLDALNLGFGVKLRLDLCRGVAPESTEQALEEMKAKGAEIISEQR